MIPKNQTLHRSSFAKIFATATLVSSLFLSCKARQSERSRLWSEQAASDFKNLVKRGRSIADHTSLTATATPAVTLGLGGAQTISFGGITSFHVEYDSILQTVAFAVFDTTRSPATSETNVGREAQRIVFSSANLLGVNPTEVQLLADASTRVNDVLTVRFARVISGIPVRDARIELTYVLKGPMWHLATLSNRGWGKAPEDGAEQTTLLTAAELSNVTGMPGLEVVGSGSQYLPQRVGAETKLYRSTWYQVKGSDGNVYTVTFSGASQPKLVEAYSHRYEQTIQAEAYKISWADSARLMIPLAGALYIAPNGTRQTLDDTGTVSAPDANGKIVLYSAAAGIYKYGAPYLTQVSPKQTGNQWVADLNDSNRPDVNVFATIVRLRNYVRPFLSDNETGYFKRRLSIATQYPSNCNAYYQTGTLTFFAAGQGCADMATVNDVVIHEWAHGLDDFTGPGQSSGNGISDGAFSEGMADALTMFITGKSELGLGFVISDPERFLRDAENDLVYTGQTFEGSHQEGTLISGAFWELRKRMIKKYGADAGNKKAETLFFKHLPKVDTYHKSYEAVQLLADDDKNPATKHPDFCLINHAFAQKGLATKDACTDGSDSEGELPAQNDLYLAINNTDAGNALTFEASASDASVASIGLCKSNNGSCSTPEIRLTYSTSKAERRIFNSNATMNVQNGDQIRILGLDANGKIVNSRVVRLLMPSRN